MSESQNPAASLPVTKPWSAKTSVFNDIDLIRLLQILPQTDLQEAATVVINELRNVSNGLVELIKTTISLVYKLKVAQNKLKNRFATSGDPDAALNEFAVATSAMEEGISSAREFLTAINKNLLVNNGVMVMKVVLMRKYAGVAPAIPDGLDWALSLKAKEESMAILTASVSKLVSNINQKRMELLELLDNAERELKPLFDPMIADGGKVHNLDR